MFIAGIILGLIIGGFIIYKATKYEIDPDDAGRYYQWNNTDDNDE